MNPHEPALRLWSNLIQAAAAVVLALSAMLLLAPAWGEAFFSLVYHGRLAGTPPPAAEQAYIRFAHGIIGAVMAGWMIAVVLLARGPFRQGRREGWRAIAWPLAAWFVVDTAFSAAHGVWGNVLLNTGTALMFAVPLWASRRHFAGDSVANPPPG
ncbi:MAG: hypothetical protein ACK57B_12380 [Betaproteobacteria bacterium]